MSLLLLLGEGGSTQNIDIGLLDQTASTFAPTVSAGGSSYSSVVLADGPNVYWKLDEASGTFIDEVAGKVLTPGGAGTQVTYNVTTGPAGVSPDISFDGTLDGATSPDDAALNVATSAFSVELWFKRTRTLATEYLIAKHANPGVTDVGWRFTIASADDTVRFADGGGGTMARTSGGVTDTLWHHVVFTKSGSTQKMYLDGSDVTAGVNVHTLTDATDQLVVARSPSNGSRFIGSIGDIAIYPTALTLTQVQNHYNAKDSAGGPSTQNLTIGLLSQTAATFAPTVTSVAAVTVGLINQTAATFSPTVTTTRNLTIGLLSQTAATFTPTVTPGAVTVSLPVIGASYTSEVLADQPSAYWRLGETSGSTPWATIPPGASGSYANSPTLGVAGALSGDANTAITLNGSNQYMAVASQTYLHPGDVLSLEIWAKRSATGNNDYIFWGGAGDYILWIDASNHLQFSKANVAAIITVTATWTDTDWHHIVVTKNGSDCHLYFDGVEPAATFTNQTLVASTEDIGIGAFPSPTFAPFHGSLDEPAIYDHALTSARVSAHYNAASSTPATRVFAPTVTNVTNVSVGLINQTAATFNPTITVGAAPVSVGLINQTAATFTPTVTPGAVNVSVGIINQTAATFTPTVTSVRNLTIGLLSQAAATFTPSVGRAFSVALINQTSATFTPSVTTLASISVALINQTATASAPTVGRNISFALINQTAATFAPTVTSLATISVNRITQTAATFDPTVTTVATASLGLINQTAVIFTPTVIQQQFVTLALLNQTATTSAPTVTTLNAISVGIITQTATPFAPTTTTTANISVGLINQTAAAFAPSLSLTLYVSRIDQPASAFDPAVQTGAFSIVLGLIDQTAVTFAPAISVGAAPVTVGIINQTAATFTPTVTTLATISVNRIDQPATAFTPTISSTYAISVNRIDQTAQTYAPTITTGAVTVVLARIDQPATTFAPSLSLTIYVNGINQTAQVFAPSAATLTTVSSQLIDQTATALAPTVTTQTSVSFGLINQTAATFAPSITTGAVNVSLALIDQTAMAFAPSVTGAGVLLLDRIDQTAVLFNPSATTTANVSLALIDQTASAFGPTAALGIGWGPWSDTYTNSIGTQVDVGLISQPALAFAPTIATVAAATVGRINQTAVAFTPTITVGAVNISLARIDRTAQTFAPRIAVSITLGRINQAAQAFQPTLSSVRAISFGRIDQTAQAFTPVVIGPQYVSLPLISRPAAAFNPTVVGGTGGKEGGEIIIVTGGGPKPVRPARPAPPRPRMPRTPPVRPAIQMLGFETIAVNPRLFEPYVERDDELVLLGLTDDDLVGMT